MNRQLNRDSIHNQNNLADTRHRSSQSTQSHYDSLSRWYDLLTTWSERSVRMAGLRMLDAQRGEAILEIGFGTGQAVLDLAKSVGDAGKVFGVDLSWGMVARARSKVASAGQSTRAALTHGDANKLPYKAEIFDAIFMSFTLELFNDEEIKAVLSECRRVLKKGGRSCVIALLRKDHANIITRIYDWAHSHFPAAIDCRPIFVRNEILHAGFHIEQAVEMTLWGLPVMLVIAKKTS